MAIRKLNFAGQRFGRWLVLRDINPGSWCECRCDCGTVRKVFAFYLKTGTTLSCGCLRSDLWRAKFLIHGAARTDKHGPTREYRAWVNVKVRCYNRKCASWRRYGGRGITMCDRWRHSFVNFLSDMGKCPDGYSLDRINNDGNYEPSNCRWATAIEQTNNQSNNRILTLNGRSQTIRMWEREMGYPRNVITQRKHQGWSDERAILQPPRKPPTRKVAA